MRIDIILPCYNPAPGWVDIVSMHTGHLRRVFGDADVGCMIINDGSVSGVTPGDQAALAQAVPGLLWIAYQPNRGKGYALRAGVARSDADIILYTDVDFPYSEPSMEACIKAVLRDEADIALAVRNDSYYSRLPASRRFISKLLRKVNRLLLGMRTSDTQGGLKVFNRKGLEVFLRTRIDRYLFDLEFIYLASKQQSLRIHPVEADLREGVQLSSVRLGILLREGWNFVRLLLKM